MNAFLEFEFNGFPYTVEEVKNNEDDGSVSGDSEASGNKNEDGENDLADDEEDTLVPMDVPFISSEEKQQSRHATKHTRPKPSHKSEKKKQKDTKKETKTKQSKSKKHLQKKKHAAKEVHHSKLKLKSQEAKKRKEKIKEHHKQANRKHNNKSKCA